MPHSPSAFLVAIVISACLGALIGVVRQWTDWAEPHRDINFGGARTFTLWAVLGCLAAGANEQVGPVGFGVIVVAVAAHQVIAMARHAHRRSGGTSYAAVLLTILIGAFVGWGDREVGVVVAAATAITLGVKRPVHAWTKAFTRDDVYAALQFVAVTGIVLPLVPNRDLGPLGAFNPYTTWLLVVLISGVGFGGYVAMRLLGARAGLLLTGVLGGIASSTATTLAFSRRSREAPELSGRCAIGIVIACVVMFIRVDVIIAVINRPLALAVAIPFAIAAAPAVLVAGVLWLIHRRDESDVGMPAIGNPLSLGTALKFGVLYAVIAFVVKGVRVYHWTQGLLPVSFVSGLTNMDAIALSLARGGGSDADALHRTAAAVLVAILGNTVFKTGVALAAGSNVVRRDVSIALGLTTLAGIAAVFVL